MAPDVILILIKDGRVEVMETGGVRIESILLNTINPFFHIWREQGLQGGVTGSAACYLALLLVVETWRSAAGDQRGSRS